MIKLWAQIANKLGITHEHALLLHAFMRGWLNEFYQRQARVVVNDIFERFHLDDDRLSYAEQLRSRGILTTTEAEVFAGNDHGNTAAGEEAQTLAPQEGPAPAGNLIPLERIGRAGRLAKRTRGPSGAA